MKKVIFLIPAIFLLFAAYSFSVDKNDSRKYDKDDPPMIMIGNYDDEEEPVKEKPKTGPQEPAKPSEKTKQPAPAKEVPVKKAAGTVEYEFDAFKIKIPAACDIQLSEDKKASSIGENSDACPVKGHLGQFNKKIENKYLVEMYRKRCENNKKKSLYKRWLNTKSMEGYLTICEGKNDSEVAMEANSVGQELNYQFLGSVKGAFTQESKVAIYMMLNSITEKPAPEAAIPAK
ncbi:MAG: hypothetical protein COT17_05950 [Elusimicrobia bacterium CG08_land_8_20_14_0_20_51_18]|nr:MAG: hypothetical protein COT17_05950 [Elusimicrobia bacterium CG08_land_8_20_14_0_20_51_18]